jgi:hypothetical protein
MVDEVDTTNYLGSVIVVEDQKVRKFRWLCITY